MKIQDFIVKPVVVCRAGDATNRAAQLMWEHDCGAIPVVHDDGRLAGIVTDRDICMAAYTQGKPLQAIPVANVMARAVFSCTEDDTLDAVERIMSAHQVRRVPVVDSERRPVGIITINDLARYAAGSRRKTGVEHDVVQTLAAICKPHHELARRPSTALVERPQPIATA